MEIFRSVTENGNIYYKNEKGDFHREDGPAIELSDGTKEWYINGERHREDGPAYEKPNGTITKVWFINGLIHREDGPSKIWSNCREDYYLNGKMYTVEDWQKHILKIKLERIKDL